MNFEKTPDTANALSDLRQQLAIALSGGTLAVCWLIAKWLIYYGPTIISVVDILLMELGIVGGIKGLDPEIQARIPNSNSASQPEPKH